MTTVIPAPAKHAPAVRAAFAAFELAVSLDERTERAGALLVAIVSNVRMTGRGCWEWQGGRTSLGYGRVFIGGGKVGYVHRMAYAAAKGGSLDPATPLDHLCRNTICCNPSHLEAVTHRINVLRGLSPAAHNAVKTHCHQGHEFTAENTYEWGGKRHCRECRRATSTEYARQKRARARAAS